MHYGLSQFPMFVCQFLSLKLSICIWLMDSFSSYISSKKCCPTFSCPSGGTKQTAAISLTASSMTRGTVGEMDLASRVSASLWSNRFLSPILLFMIAFRHLIHSSCTLSHLESLKISDVYNQSNSIKESVSYFLKHSFSTFSTCFSPLLPNSWTQSRLLLVSATLRDSIQWSFLDEDSSGLERN